MAVLFNQEAFIKDLLQKAEQQDIYDEVCYELDAFKKQDLLEYVFLLSRFSKLLNKNDIPWILRRSGGASYVAYLLGINKVHPKDYDLTNQFFVKQERIRFDFSVPNSYVGKAIELLSSIEQITDFKNGIATIGLKDYQVAILAHPALEQIINLEKETGMKYKSIPSNDKETITFMFKEYDNGFFMPNLKGCYIGALNDFYETVGIVKPKTLKDLAKLHVIFDGYYYDTSKVIKALKECGFEFTMNSREQLFSLLTDVYEVGEADAYMISDNVAHGNLVGWEELILRSREVPNYIFEQSENVRYLHYYAYGIQAAQVSYLLAYYKYHFKETFNKLLPRLPFNTSVGPFFYIGGKFYCHLEPLSSFDPNLHFFDSGVSHFDLFQTLGIDGDYGNFPRGRVVYDNLKHQCIIYIDRLLNKKELKGELLNIFEIDNGLIKGVFKFDAHYTHDGL